MLCHQSLTSVQLLAASHEHLLGSVWATPRRHRSKSIRFDPVMELGGWSVAQDSRRNMLQDVVINSWFMMIYDGILNICFEIDSYASVVVAPIRPDEKEVWFILEGGLHVAFWLHDCSLYKLPSKTADVLKCSAWPQELQNEDPERLPNDSKSHSSHPPAQVLGWFQLSTQLSHAFCDGVWRAIGCPHSASIPRHTWHRGGIYLQKLQFLKRTMVF